MTKETTDQIEKFLKEQIKNLKPEDLASYMARGCQHDDTLLLGGEYKVVDPKALASSIDGMKESTKRVKIPVAPAVVRDDDSQGSTGVLKGFLMFLGVVGGIIVMILLSNNYDSIKKLQKAMTAVQTDVGNVQKDKADKTELDKKANQADLDSVIGNVDKLADKVNQLADKVDELTDTVAVKANQADLEAKVDKSAMKKYATKRRVNVEVKILNKRIDNHSHPVVATSDEPRMVTVIIPPEDE